MSNIVPIQIPASDLELEFMQPFGNNSQRNTFKSIHSAWTSSAVIDETGTIWIRTSKLHTILRTTPPLARYYLSTVGDEYKTKVEGETYVKGSEICQLIDNIIQSSGSIKREGYARYSESLYRDIRDSETARLIRAEHYEQMRSYRGELRRTRIASFEIKRDELTGLPLRFGNQFSHIRSFAAYPRLGDKVWNGLIINQDIHTLITNNEINDENQLLDLCVEYGWKTDWYSAYLVSLEQHT